MSADAGNVTLPVTISLCETNPATGQCISTIGPTVTTQINANATPRFGILCRLLAMSRLTRRRTESLCASKTAAL